MIKALLRRFGPEIVVVALVILGLIIFNAVVTGKSFLPEPKPEPTVTPNPLQHGGLGNVTDEVDVPDDCQEDFPLPSSQWLYASVVQAEMIEDVVAQGRYVRDGWGMIDGHIVLLIETKAGTPNIFITLLGICGDANRPYPYVEIALGQ